MVRRRKLKRKKAKTFQKKILTGLLLFCFVLFLFYLCFSNYKLFLARKQLQNEYQQTYQIYKDLYQKNQELQKLFYQASQKEHLERILREKGLFKKKGEEVMVIIEE